MEAGKLRHVVELQREATAPTADSFGQVPKEPWETFATVRACVEPISGREVWQAAQVRPDLTHRVWLRFDPSFTLKAKHRIKFGTRILNISSVKNVEERNRMWEVMCVERESNED